MNYLTCPLLSDEEIKILKENLSSNDSDWEDGKKTAGSLASKVKNNLQLSRNSDSSKKNADFIVKKLLINVLDKSFLTINPAFFFEISEFLFNCKLFFTFEARLPAVFFPSSQSLFSEDKFSFNILISSSRSRGQVK